MGPPLKTATKKQVKIGLGNQGLLSHAAAQRAYQVKTWLSPASDYHKSDKTPLPIPDSSTVFLRLPLNDTDPKEADYESCSAAAPGK